MTKIETFQKAKQVAADIVRARDHAFAVNQPQNDKASVRFSFTKMVPTDWSPMAFECHASYGWYDSSSGYSVTSPELGQYLARAMQAHARTLFDYAVKLAEADAEAARKAAADEARAVLGETQVEAGEPKCVVEKVNG